MLALTGKRILKMQKGQPVAKSESVVHCIQAT